VRPAAASPRKYRNSCKCDISLCCHVVTVCAGMRGATATRTVLLAVSWSRSRGGLQVAAAYPAFFAEYPPKTSFDLLAITNPCSHDHRTSHSAGDGRGAGGRSGLPCEV
jgi:hypothetical protein